MDHVGSILSLVLAGAIVGYLGFGDFPDAVTWLGMAVIIGSGVYIAVREHEKHVGVPPDEGTVVG